MKSSNYCNLNAENKKNDLTARIEVSIGNKQCTGENFLHLCDSVIEAGYKRIEIQLSDTLHRHNLEWKLRLNSKNALQESRKLGDEWLASNAKTLTILFTRADSFSVTRWDYWIMHPKFERSKKVIEGFYKEDSVFRNLIDLEIFAYFRKLGRYPKADRIKNSIIYFIEEIAVTEFSNRLQIADEIYPGTRFEPEEYLAKTYANKRGLALGKVKFINTISDDIHAVANNASQSDKSRYRNNVIGTDEVHQSL